MFQHKSTHFWFSGGEFSFEKTNEFSWCQVQKFALVSRLSVAYLGLGTASSILSADKIWLRCSNPATSQAVSSLRDLYFGPRRKFANFRRDFYFLEYQEKNRVPRAGFEPATVCLKGNCSTNWANGALFYSNTFKLNEPSWQLPTTACLPTKTSLDVLVDPPLEEANGA